MVTIHPGLYLRVQQLDGGPTPFPLRSGFDMNTGYLALGLYNPSETSDAYFVLSNNRDEVWFICNRHLRTVELQPGATALRRPLATFERAGSAVAAASMVGAAA
jgi:hypothetical protein